MNRRDFMMATSATYLVSTSTALAQTTLGNDLFQDYGFIDYYDPTHSNFFGFNPALAEDIATAKDIVDKRLTAKSALDLMVQLHELQDTGSTGERFNARWMKYGNPLIVRFFHDIHYNFDRYPNDCTPWCAATLSWCLQRVGKPIPKVPASSQSFKELGREIDPTQEELKLGDICVFTNINDKDHGHVAFWIPGESSDYVIVLGANQDGGDVATNCGPDYPRSRVSVSKRAINKAKDASVSGQFLNKFVRIT